MKIIHCADLHLDSKMESLPSEKSKIRREEVLRSFEKLVDYAIQNEVSAVVISGDLFDTEKVTVKTRGRVISAIEKAKDISFIYLSGNHDSDNFISSLETLPNNLNVVDNKWCKYVFDNVVISSVAFDSTNANFIYDNLFLDEKNINIVALHGQIAGYKSSEKAEVISLPLLKEKNIDYLALGHIHQYAEGKLDDRGVYAYSGCLDARGFDETGEKGFVLLTIENNKLKREFVKFSSRCFYEVEYSVNGENNWFNFRNKIIQDLSEKIPKESLIKIILTGERKTDFDVDTEGLTSRLNEDYFFVKIYDKTILKVSEEDYINDKSVRGEFIKNV
ncbi:MAG: DNA repair exonuclease [Clostridia bacterium]|nr:DNA repair exonuclease [Clostridia bacterium]